MNACSCLTLILACIIYWQAREISRIAAAPDFPFDPTCFVMSARSSGIWSVPSCGTGRRGRSAVVSTVRMHAVTRVALDVEFVEGDAKAHSKPRDQERIP